MNGIDALLIIFFIRMRHRRNAMVKNVGGMDKTIRIIIGIVLLIAGIFVQMGTGLHICNADNQYKSSVRTFFVDCHLKSADYSKAMHSHFFAILINLYSVRISLRR
jgi:hypothetical protein